MMDLLAFRNTQRLEHAHETLGAKQPHEIILKGNEELRLARIALTTGTATELVIDTS